MTVNLDLTTILLALIPVIGAVIVAYLNGLTRTVAEVHQAVNSNYQAMKADLASVTAQVAALTTLTATQAETIRGADLARVLAQGGPAAPLPPLPVEIVSAAAPVPVTVVVDRPERDGALDG